MAICIVASLPLIGIIVEFLAILSVKTTTLSLEHKEHKTEPSHLHLFHFIVFIDYQLWIELPLFQLTMVTVPSAVSPKPFLPYLRFGSINKVQKRKTQKRIQIKNVRKQITKAYWNGFPSLMHGMIVVISLYLLLCPFMMDEKCLLCGPQLLTWPILLPFCHESSSVIISLIFLSPIAIAQCRLNLFIQSLFFCLLPRGCFKLNDIAVLRAQGLNFI